MSQFIIQIPNILPDGRERKLHLLVDTGSEANLVNLDLFDESLMHEP